MIDCIDNIKKHIIICNALPLTVRKQEKNTYKHMHMAEFVHNTKTDESTLRKFDIVHANAMLLLDRPLVDKTCRLKVLC